MRLLRSVLAQVGVAVADSAARVAVLLLQVSCAVAVSVRQASSLVVRLVVGFGRRVAEGERADWPKRELGELLALLVVAVVAAVAGNRRVVGQRRRRLVAARVPVERRRRCGRCVGAARVASVRVEALAAVNGRPNCVGMVGACCGARRALGLARRARVPVAVAARAAAIVRERKARAIVAVARVGAALLCSRSRNDKNDNGGD